MLDSIFIFKIIAYTEIGENALTSSPADYDSFQKKKTHNISHNVISLLIVFVRP